jgi:hypothetical protein
MTHYTNIYSKVFFSTFLSLLLTALSVRSQNCQPGYVLNPVTTNNSIEWSKFPEFSLPFKIIYSGPRFGDTQSQPLKHGFSHIAAFSGPEPGSLTASQRAMLWYGVATSSGNQPWADNTLRSPWGNDTAAYRSYWDNYASTVTSVDVVCLDIERMQREDRDILALKSNAQIPQNYRNLSDADFVTTYKRDMRWWYTEAANRLRAKGVKASLTSYSDVPIRNTWLNITANSWQDWTTNLARTHYLMQDNAGKIGGNFYNAMDFLSPSPYYYYGYDNPIGKDYLSYLLFSIESNAAWSDKPIIPFVWLRVHDSYDPNIPLITDFMAEATAIFPFFSGAKGLWLWENPFLSAERQENYGSLRAFHLRTLPAIAIQGYARWKLPACHSDVGAGQHGAAKPGLAGHCKRSEYFDCCPEPLCGRWRDHLHYRFLSELGAQHHPERQGSISLQIRSERFCQRR